MSEVFFDRGWLFVGLVVVGILMCQSVVSFTFGHFGFFLIFVGIILVVREERKNE